MIAIKLTFCLELLFLALVCSFITISVKCDIVHGEGDVAEVGDTSQFPVVETTNGKLRGIRVQNAVNEMKSHFEFRKIPYAKPPIGNLRYRLAQQPNPWSNVLNSTSFPDYCIQFNVFWNQTEGNEDCLYVNVFTPELSETLLPVMVYIHSGGFMFGRGSLFRADYLMNTRRVVVVTFQYRLGSFGFLNTEDEATEPNLGLKDQVLALKWVQSNIRLFGGNASRVTIFGTSAGAASVHYHILSPMSKGLFHNAMSSSGTALCPWAFEPNPLANAQKLGSLLHCPSSDDNKGFKKGLVECLRSKSAEEIAQMHSKFIDWYTDPINAFGPTLESSKDPNTKFLHESPRNLMKSGTLANPVPWIVGFNSDEGYEHTLGILHQAELVSELNDKWFTLAPVTLEFNRFPIHLKSMTSESIKTFYFKDKSVSHDTLKNLSNAYSDITYIHGAITSANWHAKTGQKVYLYNFDYHGQNSIVTRKGFPNEGFGSNHMDDLQYLMRQDHLFPLILDSSPDKVFQNDYLNMIVAFAETGELKLFSKLRPESVWEPLEKENDVRWFRITNKPKMEDMPIDFQKRMIFWNGILKKYEKDADIQKDEL